MFDRDDFKSRGEVERQSKNTTIQATGAMMIKLAIYNIDNYIKDNNLRDKVKLFLQIHDALYYYVIDDFAKEWSEIQSYYMIEAGKVYIKDIPVKVDVKISKQLTK